MPIAWLQLEYRRYFLPSWFFGTTHRYLYLFGGLFWVDSLVVCRFMDFSYIVVEGPIGVGKTTLTRRLANSLGGEILLEMPQDNPFLPRFYENPRAHALSTQLFFLLQRAEQMREFSQQDMLRMCVLPILCWRRIEYLLN